MKPQEFYSIGEAANLAGVTIETLRHYDRIGLLKPAKIDDESRYRYYTDTELIYLEVISFCRRNKMPLSEIRKILNADFSEVVAFLRTAESNIDCEIQRLHRTREQISALRESLEEQFPNDTSGIYTRHFEQRAILLAERLHNVGLENFRRLHEEIYHALGTSASGQFSFDRSANLLAVPTENGIEQTMFAVCIKYCAHPSVQFLEAGDYLCRTCAESDRDEAVLDLWCAAELQCHTKSSFAVLNVQFTGLFQWRYEIQVPLFQV